MSNGIEFPVIDRDFSRSSAFENPRTAADFQGLALRWSLQVAETDGFSRYFPD